MPLLVVLPPLPCLGLVGDQATAPMAGLFLSLSCRQQQQCKFPAATLCCTGNFRIGGGKGPPLQCGPSPVPTKTQYGKLVEGKSYPAEGFLFYPLQQSSCAMKSGLGHSCCYCHCWLQLGKGPALHYPPLPPPTVAGQGLGCGAGLLWQGAVPFLPSSTSL